MPNSLQELPTRPLPAGSVRSERDDPDDPVATFDALRPRLLGIAYRVLGSWSEAEDLVQEAWLRWQLCDRAVVRNSTAFLVTTTTRLAITAAQTARVRRESYVGRWLPEPVDTSNDPSLGAERAEALQLGILVLLEKLSPTERAAFVLREAFDYPYHRIAEILQVNEANARQLVSRAGKRVRSDRRRPADAESQQRLMHAFVEASQRGAVATLESLLAADVVSLSDGGGVARAARVPVAGRERVAVFVAKVSKRFWAGASVEWVEANGRCAAALDTRRRDRRHGDGRGLGRRHRPDPVAGQPGEAHGPDPRRWGPALDGPSSAVTAGGLFRSLIATDQRRSSAMSPHVLEPDAQALADATATPPLIYELGPEGARKVLDDLQAMPVDKLAVDDEWVTVPADIGDVAVRIVRPPDCDGPLPVVLYLHGGGWVLGNSGTHDRLVRELAVGARAAVVFVEYERSPEARHPVAVEQAYAVAQWVTKEGGSVGLDASRLVVAGDSVGGNMATVVAILAAQRGDVTFLHQSLYYPVTDAAQDTESYREFADGPFLTAKAMAWYWDAYLPEVELRGDVTASPLRATRADLASLPDTLVIVDENDVLRDEGEAYARRLTEAGVRTTCLRYNGIIHDFMMLNPLRQTAASTGAVEQAIHVLRKALGTD